MSKYFSYCPEDGFITHNTEKEAKKAARASIDFFRDNAEEGWHEEVDKICWGEVKAVSTKFNEMTNEEAIAQGVMASPCCDYACDYQLQPIN